MTPPTAAWPLPGRRSVALALGCALAATGGLAAGLPLAVVAVASAVGAGLWAAAAALDLWRAHRAWQAAPPTLQRRLPAALALGVPRDVLLTLTNPGPTRWQVQVYDHPDPRLGHSGLPLALVLPPQARVQAAYTLRPTQRGAMRFAPCELRVATPWRLFELRRRIGAAEPLRVYPDFAQVARYAWLAGDRRLSEIGIKTYTQRGEGTDFKELAEYRPGDDIRHIDWKATLRFRRPIVREFQDERDQCVLFLLDGGRRMRASEDAAADGLPAGTTQGIGGSHFDHALNALLLLAHVALASGDEVGVMTYGSTPEQARFVAPRKGRATLHTLMAALYDVQPQPVQSDLQQAAAALMRRHSRRSLVVVLSNLRDEDADEVAPALRLLRTRHLVLLASLREVALRTATEQPLATATAARRVAAAHAMAQSRRDAFARLAGRDALLLDTEPQALAAALVNRYHAVKSSGLL